MKTTLAICMILAASVTLAVATYPGCRTALDCQAHGDFGAYCRANGFCHCNAPYWNSTQGTCLLDCCPTCAVKCCRTNEQCQAAGDTLAYCRRIDQGGNGACHCGTGYTGTYCTHKVDNAVNVMVAGGPATITDCGTSSTHGKFTSLSVTPNPPVKGSLATVNGTGTLDESVTAGNYELAVALDGNQLYTHTGNACGQSTINLPLGFGTIDIDGVACPASAGPFKASMGLTLPTGVPSGNYDITFSATDQNKASLFCMDIKFSF